MDTPSSHFVGVAGVLAAGVAVISAAPQISWSGARRRRLVANHTDMLRAVALALLGPVFADGRERTRCASWRRTEGVRRADRQSACQHAS